MLHTISPQDMRDMEAAFMDGTGYPSLLLMEHAAQAVVDALTGYVSKGATVLFVCGGGNNGGDGCAAARLYQQSGGHAVVWLLKSPTQMKGDAGVNACLLGSCCPEQTVVFDEAPELPQDCAAIVDALFGTGLARALDGAALALVQRINASGLPVISVDIPSGVDGCTGAVLGEAVRATQTITFHRPKHGHLLFPGRACAGRLTIADIGILPEWDGADGYDILEDADASALLPERAADSHKGTFGHALVVAGSEGMAGAAVLCANACLRAGAGLVTAACAFTVRTPMQIGAPCAMAKVVSDGEYLGEDAADALNKLTEGKRALAIGPGLGQNEETWTAIEGLVLSDTPKVLDADGLNLLAKYGDGKVGRHTVLTPHPGEAARLLGMTTAEIAANPVDAACQLAEKFGCCALLKGATTVIAQGDDITLNTTGCDGMGTGGSGDVLTGVIAALMAQGMRPYDAARVGAFYHGRAGQSAQAARGARAVTAMDICEALRIE